MSTYVTCSTILRANHGLVNGVTAGCYTAVMSRSPACSNEEFRRFVDQYRARCLWFLREDYYPQTPAEREEVLRQIAQHGDRAAFLRVAQFRTWLSQSSSATSASS